MDATLKDLDLSSLVLLRGSHEQREKGVCLLEAVAWFAGLPHSDYPECTDVALAAYGRSLNDRLLDDERQALRDLVPRLVGTKGSRALARRRAYHLVDRHLRTNLPAWFRELPNKPRPDIAARLEGLPPVVDGKSANRARDLAREIRDEIRSTLSPAAADAAAYAAAAYAAAAADAAYAAASADADAAYKALRKRTIERSIASFVEAIEMTEDK